ncbi:MAG TPA: hypothetical protein VGB22_06985 [candidate division Zixibacteria bacterium]|jgi:hypothetical protein
MNPNALPAPPALFVTLLGATFVLHLAALGLLVAAIWTRFGAEWSEAGSYAIEPIHRAGIVGFSMVITLGVPPLLFVQVLYGKYFYGSSIGIGYPWLAIVGYLMIGFYSLYLSRWCWDRHNGPSAGGKLFLILTVASMILIGWTYSWNHLRSLSTTPWECSVTAAQVMSRLTGYLGAILTASAACRVWFGRGWRTAVPIQTGAAIAFIAGGVLALYWAMTSAHATGSWGWAGRLLQLAGALVSIGAGVIGLVNRGMLLRLLALLSGFAVLSGMSLQRESYRLLAIGIEYDPALRPVDPQWSPLAMFLLAVVIGIGVLAWLLRLVRQAQSQSTL